MRILFDTNVILDLLLTREPFLHEAAKAAQYMVDGKFIGMICANSVTTVFYYLRKAIGQQEAQQTIKKLVSGFEVTSVDKIIIGHALASNFEDFEDAVIYFSALHSGAEGIVTRNPKGFKKSKIPVYSPKSLLAIL